MKVAIVGSRDFKDGDFVYRKLNEILRYWVARDTTIVSGGAKGVDSIAETFAEHNFCKKLIFHAEWEKHGKKAGYLRNIKIVENSDMVIVFWDGRSKGTKHSIDLAIKAGKPIDIFIRS